MFFVIEKAKETVLDFSQGTVKVLHMQFLLNTKYSLIFINIKNDKIQQFKCEAIKLNHSLINLSFKSS